jgi:hypothetical protein
MSTYQEPLRRRFVPAGTVMRATHFPVRLDRRVEFAELRKLLTGLLLTQPGEPGALVNNFATLTAAWAPGRPEFAGHLHVLLVAESDQRVDALGDEVRARLRTIEARD